MDDASSKKLLIRLVTARSESEVRKIIESDPLLSGEENWKPYGGYESNFNTINNQAKNSVAALAEKPINSIDALLLKECKLRGIDPESKQSPKSMKEATELFFGIKSGDFSDLADKERRRLAGNIQIIAEGDRKSPNLIIADKGEGQYPDDFESTFLSLHRGNRMRILKNDNQSIEENCPPIIPIIAELGKFGKRTVEVTVFKEGTVKDEFASSGEVIFFTINGQTHATIGRSFLRTKANLHIFT